jgi:pimeloyl-ACP methyl ester carboxylesterase
VQEEDMQGTGVALRSSTIDIDGQSIFYVESGDPEKQMVLFVHGTPGSWQGYAAYLQNRQLAERAHLVAMDRPGFGRSVRDQVPGFRDQASILMQMRSLNRSGLPIILVGHSLGGSIAYRMLADFPEEISGAVVISASVDPELGKARWYNRIADFSLVSLILPDGLVRANEEIMPLREELMALSPLLGEVRASVTIIHGQQDKLVSFGNLAFAKAALNSANVKPIPVPGMGHFVLWEQPDLIVREILLLLDETSASDMVK